MSIPPTGSGFRPSKEVCSPVRRHRPRSLVSADCFFSQSAIASEPSSRRKEGLVLSTAAIITSAPWLGLNNWSAQQGPGCARRLEVRFDLRGVLIRPKPVLPATASLSIHCSSCSSKVALKWTAPLSQTVSFATLCSMRHYSLQTIAVKGTASGKETSW
jgi:hypothetical protein